MPGRIIPYKPHLKELARQLRNNSTISEALLWQHLNRKQMMGFDFHRQKPLDRYIVDFYCPELMLAIEVDGDSHEERFEIDIYRQRRLEAKGIQFLRFTDLEIKKNIDRVLESIKEWIKSRKDNTLDE